MMSKNKILALFLAVILIVPVFAFDVAASASTSPITDRNSDVGNSVFIDYFAEKIWVLPQGVTGNNNIIDESTSNSIQALAETASMVDNGTPKYMYALKAVSPAQLDKFRRENKPDKIVNALSKEKWYPIYGGGIDITRHIPNKAAKTAEKAYCIAIRRADDIFNNINGFESRVAFIIAPRYNNKFNKDLMYDAQNEVIKLADAAQFTSVNVVYKFELFPSDTVKLSKTTDSLSVPANDFALGTTVHISTAPGPIGTTFYARSRIVKFKVPRQPAAPNVRLDTSNKRISGLRRTGIEFSFTDPEINRNATWEDYKGDVTTFNITTASAFNAAFPGFSSSAAFRDTTVDTIPIYIRNKASKSPASKAVKIEVPRSLLTS